MAQSIIDSHVHLWPESAANADGHAWMGQVKQLAKQHVLTNYYRAANIETENDQYHVEGIIYIETDRRYSYEKDQALGTWAAGPLKEIRFLRSIVEGEYGQRDASMLKGIVTWAPVDRGLETFQAWLKLAEQTAGPETWGRVKGFRFLLQAITDQAQFETLVCSDAFSNIMKSFSAGGRDWVFDVGIDQHSGGSFQLQAWVKVLEQLRLQGCNTVFVINHLCKPDMTKTDRTNNVKDSSDFITWRQCIERMASFSNVYMKLSGAFSELSTSRVETTSSASLASRVKPWTDTVFETFGPSRIMFGSDWPVCNIRGPGDGEPWRVWRDVVQHIVAERGLSEMEAGRVWAETAIEAYRLNAR